MSFPHEHFSNCMVHSMPWEQYDHNIVIILQEMSNFISSSSICNESRQFSREFLELGSIAMILKKLLEIGSAQ